MVRYKDEPLIRCSQCEKTWEECLCFQDWMEQNLSSLESDFIQTFPREEQPLDDDTPDFLQRYAEDLECFALNHYKEVIK